MKHAKHTPGPWTVGRALNGYHRVNPICTLDPHPGGISEANARLIAAAPELLELLQRVILEGYVRDGETPEHQLLVAIENAIAKATGGAE